MNFLTKKRPARKNLQKIPVYDESFLLKYFLFNSRRVRRLRLAEPFKIKKCSVPKIMTPKELEVTVH